MDRICRLFQDFYVRADSHIATHISTLASRINRDSSPQKPRRTSLKDGRTGREGPTQQMLTASEVTERRKARKQLAYKKVALEEAVERRVCEKVYDKIWRHKSTLDEVRDEKLRSKTAALSVLGIGMRDLGIEIPAANDEVEKAVRDKLALASESLFKMNDERYPLGKLQHLIAAHKAIVDTLTILLPSSSSADEILPTLIYTLITSPIDGLNVISNLVFIQRFRSANKIDGEAAYCLTNLEAAITFLENVDLSSLSSEVPADGQPRLLNATTMPSTERPTEESPAPTVTSASAAAELSKPSQDPSPNTPKAQLSTASSQQRRLSNLFQPPARVLGAANDVVRSTADQGLKNISTTLDNSFNFLFGRLKELQTARADQDRSIVPKTLDEARRLVTAPSAARDTEAGSEDSSVAESTAGEQQQPGRSATFQPSSRRQSSAADGRRSPNSSDARPPNQRGLQPSRTNSTPSPSVTASALFSPSPGSTPLDSMRNLGSAINPLNHIPGMIRGFGRSAAETPATGNASPAAGQSAGGPTATAALQQFPPPLKRFLEVKDAQDLRLGEVAELLEEYKRLATAVLSATGGVPR